MHRVCPRCGKDSHVEELGVTLGSVWLHCQACRHLWRQAGPGLDAFSVLLARAAVAMPLEEECPPHGTPRATRFQVRLHVRYRPPAAVEWNHGLTENISRSGVLFRARAPIEPTTDIELLLTVPGSGAGEPEARIRSRGSIVRSNQPADVPGAMVAAAVEEYAFAQV